MLLIRLLLLVLCVLLLPTFNVCLVCFVFFFFQAEDGIRDLIVTGVQTCALPISQAERNGDFSDPALAGTPIFNPFSGDSADCFASGSAGLNCGTSRSQFVASSAPGVATVPGPNGPVDAFNPACTSPTGCPNMIPSAFIDPIAAKILALVP